MPGELADLEKGRARIEQPVDAVADEHLATGLVLRTGRRRPALLHLADQRTQVLGEAAIHGGIRGELR